MNTKKEKAIKNILSDFEKFANLILQQLEILETFVNSDGVKMPDDMYGQIKKNEDIFATWTHTVKERFEDHWKNYAYFGKAICEQDKGSVDKYQCKIKNFDESKNAICMKYRLPPLKDNS